MTGSKALLPLTRRITQESITFDSMQLECYFISEQFSRWLAFPTDNINELWNFPKAGVGCYNVRLVRSGLDICYGEDHDCVHIIWTEYESDIPSMLAAILDWSVWVMCVSSCVLLGFVALC